MPKVKYKKRADGRYQKQITIGIKPNGKPDIVTLYGKTVAELEAKVREIYDQLYRGTYVKPNSMTVEELSALWLKNKKFKQVKDQTYKQYKSDCSSLNKRIGKIPVQKLTITTIEKLRSELLENNQNCLYNTYLKRLKAMLDYAIEIRLVGFNVAQVQKPVKHSSPVKRALTYEEKRIIAATEFTDRERCLISLLLYTGMREAEILALDVKDIDLAKKQIKVHKTVVQSSDAENRIQMMTKTAAGTRTLPISSKLYPIIEQYVAGKDGLLFPGRFSAPLTHASLHLIWKKMLLKMAEKNDGQPMAKDLTPHLFRHNYASDLAKAGVEPQTAKYLMGHSSIKMTFDLYAHFGYIDVNIDALEKYYKKLSQSESSQGDEEP